MSVPEAWLRGPVHDVDPVLLPAAHALMQASEDLERAASGLTVEQVWVKPGGAASIGFHLKHIAASTDRLLSYARGEALTPDQMRALADEGKSGEPPSEVAPLVLAAQASLGAALAALRSVPVGSLFEARSVGRAKLPTTVFGLLFHAGEHAQRHAGQIITTAKIVRGMAPGTT